MKVTPPRAAAEVDVAHEDDEPLGLPRLVLAQEPLIAAGRGEQRRDHAVR